MNRMYKGFNPSLIPIGNNIDIPTKQIQDIRSIEQDIDKTDNKRMNENSKINQKQNQQKG